MTGVVVFVAISVLLTVVFGPVPDEQKLTFALTAYGVMAVVLVTLCLQLSRKLKSRTLTSHFN